MKIFILISLMFCISINALAIAKNDDEQVERIYPTEINVINSFTRGIVNAFTFWLEVPRNIILDANQYPFFGTVSGAMKGLYFAGARACLSVTDVLMLGFTGPSAYNPDIFPEYVWDSQWNPYTTNIPPEYVIIKEDADVREAQNENMEVPY